MSLIKLTNWPLILSSIFLLSFGILTILSSSKDLALQQLIFAIFGILFFLIISNFDYKVIRGLIFPLYIIIILLLVLVSILGVETRGSIRWIPLGWVNIQPSEFAKPVLILLLADFWTKNAPAWKNIFKSILLLALPLFLIFRQPDLGTTLSLLALWIGIFAVISVSLKKVLVILIVALLTIPLAWFVLHDYQKQRITSFLSPGNDPLGMGYNIIQSTIAVGSGQLMGRGLGSGTQSRLQFLPEYNTDFIFASISEELGLLGAVTILIIYLFMIGYCLRITYLPVETFGSYIIFGVVSVLLFQIVVNIGMNIGLVPITGITLPLISYGGSSLVATMIMLGLVASVAKYNMNRFDDVQFHERG